MSQRAPRRTPKEKIEDAFLDLPLEDQATILQWLTKDHAVCKRERTAQAAVALENTK